MNSLLMRPDRRQFPEKKSSYISCLTSASSDSPWISKYEGFNNQAPEILFERELSRRKKSTGVVVSGNNSKNMYITDIPNRFVSQGELVPGSSFFRCKSVRNRSILWNSYVPTPHTLSITPYRILHRRYHLKKISDEVKRLDEWQPDPNTT